MNNLAQHLQRMYESEINLSISWFFDGGIDVSLGDKYNATLAETNLRNAKDILPWLQMQIRQHLPESEYAKSL